MAKAMPKKTQYRGDTCRAVLIEAASLRIIFAQQEVDGKTAWTILGGGQQSDEDHVDTLIRRCGEEGGFVLNPNRAIDYTLDITPQMKRDLLGKDKSHHTFVKIFVEPVAFEFNKDLLIRPDRDVRYACSFQLDDLPLYGDVTLSVKDQFSLYALFSKPEVRKLLSYRKISGVKLDRALEQLRNSLCKTKLCA